MRTRRHVEAQRTGRSGRSWARLARELGLVAGVFVLGYVAVAFWISPAPLLGTENHSIPRVLGLSAAEARQQLEALGFRTKDAGSRTHPTAPAGTVIWQDPPPGVVLSPNETVALVVSTGAPAVRVPDVVGLDTATARRILTAAGSRVGEISIVAGKQEGGVVVGTRPAVGVARRRGAKVDLVVSRGPEEYP